MRLHSYCRSSASYRVRIALGLKSLPYEYVAVNLLQEGGEQNSAGYRRLNPNARVPTLEVDGAALTQSLAIIEYLDEAHPAPPLLPVAPIERARVRALAQLIAADIQPLQNTSVTGYLAATHGLKAPEITQWYRHWIGRGLAALEAMLAVDDATGRYCHGDAPTLADVCLVPQVYAARRFGVEIEACPTVLRIEAACQALPAFAAAAPERQPDFPVQR